MAVGDHTGTSHTAMPASEFLGLWHGAQTMKALRAGVNGLENTPRYESLADVAWRCPGWPRAAQPGCP